MIKIVAEAGINFAFGEDTSKFIKNIEKLISISSTANCDYIKFQKRTPVLAVPDSQKNKPKTVPWRNNPITYLEYKEDIELNIEEYQYIIAKCQENDIESFTSVWDIQAALEMAQLYDLVKIPSAKLTDWELLEGCKDLFDVRILSTGMSTEEEIERAVDILKPQVIFHTNSVYPSPIKDLNLGYIKWLKEKYPKKEIGYSNHAYGIVPMIATVLLDIQWLEFHVTENHEYWGSDQLSSIEPSGIFKVVRGIRNLEKAYKGYGPRGLFPGEEVKKESLRGDK